MSLIHDIGVARRLGRYSDAIEVPSQSRLLFISGTLGLAPDGTLPPTLIGQAEQAWRNVIAVLERAEMALGDLVMVTQYLTRADDISDYVNVRTRFMKEHRPASMLTVVPALVRPDVLVEIQAIAARGVDDTRSEKP
jgi:2-iminobutanoate/2-iminopropanoate deaminase